MQTIQHRGARAGKGREMAEFPQRAQKLLKKVPEQYKGDKVSVVNLISSVTGSGSKAGKELQELKQLVDALLGLQEEFVQTYDKSCQKSMEQFMQMVHDLGRTQTMITSLKQKILRLRGATGSYAGDLRNFYKKKQRNIYLLQLLHAVKKISTMESTRTALLAQGEHYKSTNLLAACQLLLEQWPTLCDERGTRPEMGTIHSQLLMLLSKEKIASHVTSLENVLIDNILRRDRLTDAKTFASIIEGDELAAEKQPAHATPLRIVGKTNCYTDELEQVPIQEGIQLWRDNAPLITCLPHELLNAVMLRIPYILPPKVSAYYTATVKTTAYVGFKGAYNNEEENLSQWTSVTLPFTTIGDSMHEECEVVEPKWVFYKQAVEAKATCTFPTSIEKTPMLMFVVPEIADPAERQRSGCLSALHLLGNVGYPKPTQEQRILEVVGHILQPSFLTQHHINYIDTFMKAFDNWRTKKITDAEDCSTKVLAGLRDIASVRAASALDGTLGTLDPFEYERKIASAQQPLLQQFISALSNELLEVLRNYVDLTSKTFERCFPQTRDGTWDPSRCTLSEDDLKAIAQDLVACTEQAPEQDSESLPALEIVKRATTMLLGEDLYKLSSLVGPRRKEGWLGVTAPSNTFTMVTKPKVEDPLGLMLDKQLNVTSAQAGSISHKIGLARFVGFRVSSVKLPGHTERIMVDTLEEFNQVIKHQVSFQLFFSRKVRPPQVHLSVVCEHIMRTCKAAGMQLGHQDAHVEIAQKALVEKADEAAQEVVSKLTIRHSLSLESCWECLQVKVSPLLESLCKEELEWNRWDTQGLGSVRRGSAQARVIETVKRKEDAVLEKLLEGRFGQEKLPRLLDATPPVRFSFRDVASIEEEEKEVDIILKHFIPTPFNTVFLYRAVVQFTSEASRLVYGRVQGSANILIKTLELRLTKELLPKIKTHYYKQIDNAMDHASPVYMSQGDSDEVPVLEAFVIAGHALQTLAELQEAIPINQAAKMMMRSYVEGILKKILTRSLEHLENKTYDIYCGTIGVPLVKKVLDTCDEDDIYKAESLDSAARDMWHTMSEAADVNVTSNTLEILDELHSKSKSRSHKYIKSSQDVSFITCLAHSLEWLADQTVLHWGQTEAKSEFTMSEKIFLAKTECYDTVIPGVDAMHDNTPGDGPWQPVQPPRERLSHPAVDNLWKKLMVLSRGAFFVLVFDLFTRTQALLDSRDTSFDHEYDAAEPDEAIEVFNRDMRMMHITYTNYLPPLKQQYLMQALPMVVAYYLIKNIANLKHKYVTKCGVARLTRNVFALQQNLALLVTEVAESDDQFIRVKRYYEMLTCDHAELVVQRENLKEYGITYNEDEFGAAVAVVSAAWSRKGGVA